MLKETSIAHSIHVGCQTNAWPVIADQPQTLAAALDDIGELSFQGFETGFRNALAFADGGSFDNKGMTAFGVHIFLPEYDAVSRLAPLELILQAAGAAQNIGAERLILSGAPAPETAAHKKAEALNEVARQLQPFGLQLAYHNHAPEVTGPNAEIEILLEATDPKLVSLLLDAGHAFRAGIELEEFIVHHAARITGIHLRDFKDGRQVPLGKGDFPTEAVAAVLRDSGWAGWVLAEEEREDGSKPGRNAAAVARTTLKRAFGV